MSKIMRTPKVLPSESIEKSAKAVVVLRAARDVFLAHGFSAATTDMIQREAGVSKSTVYAHFANKEILFTAVIEAECANFVNMVRNIEFHPGKLQEMLTTLAHTYLNIVLSPTALSLFRVVIAEAPRFPQLSRSLYLAGPHAITGILSEHLTKAEMAGEIDLAGMSRDVVAGLFINLVRSKPHLECLTHPHSKPSEAQFEEWVQAAVTTFMRAYGRGDGQKVKELRGDDC
jgi:AcrR family transcriptional regulator